jgi:hypothetical protein
MSRWLSIDERKMEEGLIMEKKEISFSELKESIIKFLESKRAIVLATAANNRVTARTVSFVNDELRYSFYLGVIILNVYKFKKIQMWL